MWRAISRFGRDSIALTRAIYFEAVQRKDKTNMAPGEIIKSVLLEQSRGGENSIAPIILKEIGLMKYLGFTEYLKRGMLATSTGMPNIANRASSSGRGPPSVTTAANKSSGNSNASTANTSTASVAFMITSSMKRDLIDGLGYDMETIRRMKPQQASLVLHNRINSESYNEQAISILENELGGTKFGEKGVGGGHAGTHKLTRMV